jgi:CRISPR-associated endonuclease/helicase Cas3
MTYERYLTYWGKAQPYLVWAQLWHPAAYHCLDVAAVAECLLATRPELLVRLASRLGVPWRDFSDGLVHLMATHDVGKFAESFQCSIPLSQRDPRSICREVKGGKAHHTHLLNAMLKVGQGSLDPCSWALFDGWPRKEILEVLRPISGHHGQPPLETNALVAVSKGVDPEDLKDGLKYLSIAARDDIDEYLRDLQRILPVRPWPAMDAAGRAALSLGLSGFAVLCDWMGSSREWFPYRAPAMSLEKYWTDVARVGAGEAVRLSGVTRTRLSMETGLANVFPRIAASPRPMQAAADTIPLPAGGCLAIIEDVTGSGKTEAAITLAHRMAAEGKGDGIFLGLPTMATSDAMFTRVTQAANGIYPPGSEPDIVLSHGGSTRKRRAVLDVRHDGDEDGSVGDYIESWLASDKRSALLADFGVGTVDQALLAVLATRYQGLRLYGLAGKVLILDEVHSYDTYMFEEIKALLKFHAFLGGSAVVMSATLSLADRSHLCQAFSDGLRRDALMTKPSGRAKASPSLSVETPPATAYPAIHIVTNGGLRSCEVAACEDLRRYVEVDLAHSWDAVDARLAACLTGGGCACVVRSTVDEAIETHGRLAAAGWSPTLLHARFMPGDRACIQDEVMLRFGSKAPWEGRAGGLVVATQVIEQSLDVDFDLLVTDVAPIELIVQRAGRVARHVEVRRKRNLPCDRSSLVMVVPDPDDVAGPDWLDGLVAGAAAVYPDHGRLWSAASLMKRQGGFQVPEGVRSLVEECTLAIGVPPQLMRRSKQAKNEEHALAGVGRIAVLDPRKGYSAHGQWLEDTRIQTRVGSLRRSLRLGFARGDRVLPLPLSNGDSPSWAESSVEVSASRASRAMNAVQYAKAVKAVMARWSRHEKDSLLVVCRPVCQGRWAGTVVDAKGHPRSFHYERSRGLEWGGSAQ